MRLYAIFGPMRYWYLFKHKELKVFYGLFIFTPKEYLRFILFYSFLCLILLFKRIYSFEFIIFAFYTLLYYLIVFYTIYSNIRILKSPYLPLFLCQCLDRFSTMWTQHWSKCNVSYLHEPNSYTTYILHSKRMKISMLSSKNILALWQKLFFSLCVHGVKLKRNDDANSNDDDDDEWWRHFENVCIHLDLLTSLQFRFKLTRIVSFAQLLCVCRARGTSWHTTKLWYTAIILIQD